MLDSKKDRLALRLAAGENPSEAAEACGIAVGTAYRWAKEPEVLARVGQLRSEAAGQIVGILTKAAGRAVEVLLEVLDSQEVAPRDRVAAARAVLALLPSLSEFGELRRRIEELESQSQRERL